MFEHLTNTEFAILSIFVGFFALVFASLCYGYLESLGGHDDR